MRHLAGRLAGGVVTPACSHAATGVPGGYHASATRRLTPSTAFH
jgi:hypothetical protein